MSRLPLTILYNTCDHVVKSRLKLISALRDAGYDVTVVAPRDAATECLYARGISHRPIAMSQYGMNPLQELASIREIRGIFRDLRPVASLHYTIKPNIFGAIAAHQAGIPVLNNIAGAGRVFSGSNPALRALVKGLYRHTLRRSHTVFFQNGDDMAAFTAARIVRGTQCVRIPGSGVDLARFRPTPLPDGPIRFLFAGRLLREKGIAEFLNAAHCLLAEGDPYRIRFDIAGEHETGDRSFISRVVLEQLTAAPQITYHGAVAPMRIDQLIRGASCVVLPSYYGEGVPRVLLEACASGRPIVTTDNVGCRDVVEPGVNGWQVPSRDAAALANAMKEYVAMSRSERAALGMAARRTVETRFDENTVIQAYLERINAVANMPTARLRETYKELNSGA